MDNFILTAFVFTQSLTLNVNVHVSQNTELQQLSISSSSFSQINHLYKILSHDVDSLSHYCSLQDDNCSLSGGNGLS